MEKTKPTEMFDAISTTNKENQETLGSTMTEEHLPIKLKENCYYRNVPGPLRTLRELM